MEINTVNHCKGCGGRCCMDYVVPLSIEDVKRIVENARFKPEFFVDFTPVDDMEFRCPDIRIDGLYAYMTLRRDGGGCCVFSFIDGDEMKCRIHSLHPLACRIYPFAESDGRVAHRRKFRCERKWNIDSGNQEGIRKLLKQRDAEIRDYEALALSWNKRGGGSRSQFLSFIL